MHTPHTMTSPQRIGDYQTIAKIADGGMAEVFLAVRSGEEGFEKRVAIKKILPFYARDDSFVRSFINEARLCGQLTHPNLVQVYGFDREGDSLSLVMEFIDGIDLERIISHRILKRQSMPPGIIAEVVLQMLEGLDYAHTAHGLDGKPLNVVHRDLKPSNVLIDQSGFVKIVDFGVAKASNNLYKTMNQGTAKGTVSYMSPEQATGKTDLGPQSDLFSVGAILYEMLTGARLFDGDNLFAILDAVRSAPLEPLISAPEVPEIFRPILRTALTRELTGRFATASEMASKIRQTFPDLPGPSALIRFVAELRREGLEIVGASPHESVAPRSRPSAVTLHDGSPEALKARADATAPLVAAPAGVVPGAAKVPAAVPNVPRVAPTRQAINQLHGPPQSPSMDPSQLEPSETTEWNPRTDRAALPGPPRARVEAEAPGRGRATQNLAGSDPRRENRPPVEPDPEGTDPLRQRVELPPPPPLVEPGEQTRSAESPGLSEWEEKATVGSWKPPASAEPTPERPAWSTELEDSASWKPELESGVWKMGSELSDPNGWSQAPQPAPIPYSDIERFLETPPVWGATTRPPAGLEIPAVSGRPFPNDADKTRLVQVPRWVEPSAVPAVPKTSRRTLLLAAIVFLVLVLLGFGLRSWFSGPVVVSIDLANVSDGTTTTVYGDPAPIKINAHLYRVELDQVTAYEIEALRPDGYVARRTQFVIDPARPETWKIVLPFESPVSPFVQ